MEHLKTENKINFYEFHYLLVISINDLIRRNYIVPLLDLERFT